MKSLSSLATALLLAMNASAQTSDAGYLSEAKLEIVVLKASEKASESDALKKVGTALVPPRPPGVTFREKRTSITAVRTRPCLPGEGSVSPGEMCTEFFLETFFIR